MPTACSGQIIEVSRFRAACCWSPIRCTRCLRSGAQRARVIVEGEGRIDVLDVNHVASTMDVRPGDSWSVPGWGSVFGRLSGRRVVESYQRPGKPFAVVVARPAHSSTQPPRAVVTEAEAAPAETAPAETAAAKTAPGATVPAESASSAPRRRQRASRRVTRAWPGRPAVRATSRASRCRSRDADRVAALLVSLYPLPVWLLPARPDLLALVVIFWVIALPQGFGSDRPGCWGCS